MAHNDDLEGIREYFRELREIKPDALIISDPGVFQIAKEEAPEILLSHFPSYNNHEEMQAYSHIYE